MPLYLLTCTSVLRLLTIKMLECITIGCIREFISVYTRKCSALISHQRVTSVPVTFISAVIVSYFVLDY